MHYAIPIWNSLAASSSPAPGSKLYSIYKGAWSVGIVSSLTLWLASFTFLTTKCAVTTPTASGCSAAMTGAECTPRARNVAFVLSAVISGLMLWEAIMWKLFSGLREEASTWWTPVMASKGVGFSGEKVALGITSGPSMSANYVSTALLGFVSGPGGFTPAAARALGGNHAPRRRRLLCSSGRSDVLSVWLSVILSLAALVVTYVYAGEKDAFESLEPLPEPTTLACSYAGCTVKETLLNGTVCELGCRLEPVAWVPSSLFVATVVILVLQLTRCLAWGERISKPWYRMYVEEVARRRIEDAEFTAMEYGVGKWQRYCEHLLQFSTKNRAGRAADERLVHAHVLDAVTFTIERHQLAAEYTETEGEHKLVLQPALDNVPTSLDSMVKRDRPFTAQTVAREVKQQVVSERLEPLRFLLCMAHHLALAAAVKQAHATFRRAQELGQDLVGPRKECHLAIGRTVVPAGNAEADSPERVAFDALAAGGAGVGAGAGAGAAAIALTAEQEAANATRIGQAMVAATGPRGPDAALETAAQEAASRCMRRVAELCVMRSSPWTRRLLRDAPEGVEPAVPPLWRQVILELRDKVPETFPLRPLPQQVLDTLKSGTPDKDMQAALQKLLADGEKSTSIQIAWAMVRLANKAHGM